MKRFLLNLGLGIILFVLCGFLLNILFEKFGERLINREKFDWIFSLEDSQVDYCFLGSSRILNAIDCERIDQVSGRKAINLGTRGASFAESYLALKEFLRSNSTRTVVLNVDEFQFNSKNSVSVPFHYNLLYDHFSDPDYQELFYDYMPRAQYVLWKVFPVSRYFEFGLDLGAIRGTKKTRGEWCGYEASPDRKFRVSQLNLTNKKPYPISEVDKRYLEKIVELCDINNLKLIFVTTPIYDDYPAYSIRTKSVYGWVEEYTEKNGISFIHYDQLDFKIETGLFSDRTHLNAYGAGIYSEKLGNRLIKENE